MERERPLDNDQRRQDNHIGPPPDELENQRHEIDELLRATDQAFDMIDYLQAHDYLEQNLQTGGQ